MNSVREICASGLPPYTLGNGVPQMISVSALIWRGDQGLNLRLDSIPYHLGSGHHHMLILHFFFFIIFIRLWNRCIRHSLCIAHFRPQVTLCSFLVLCFPNLLSGQDGISHLHFSGNLVAVFSLSCGFAPWPLVQIVKWKDFFLFTKNLKYR